MGRWGLRFGFELKRVAGRTLVSQDILPGMTLAQSLEGTMVIDTIFLGMYTPGYTVPSF